MNWVFILVSNDTGDLLRCKSPVGFDETGISLLRNKKYWGVFTSITVDFQFIFDGYNWIVEHINSNGIDSDIEIIIYKHGKFLYRGKLNFEGYENDVKLRLFQVDVIDNGFSQKFLNRDRTKVNILSDTSIDGNEVIPARMFDSTLRGKVIQLYSELVLPEENQEDQSIIIGSPRVLPMQIEKNDNPQVFYVATVGTPTLDPYPEPEFFTSTNAIYVNDKSVSQEISLTFNYEVSIAKIEPFYDFLDPTPKVHIRIERRNSSDLLQETYVNKTYSSLGYFTYSTSFTPTMSTGDYLIAYVQPEYSKGVGYSASFSDCLMIINEDSIFQDTTCKTILAHELFESLISQITGNDYALIAPVFGRTDILDENGTQKYQENGKWAFLGIHSGLQVRGFQLKSQELVEEDEIAFTGLATSFEEAWKSFNSREPLGLKILDEKVYIDLLENMFSNEVVLDLGNVNNLKITPAGEYYYSEIEIGDEDIEFESVNGLDEYNSKASYTTEHKTYSNKLELVSEYSASTYAKEFARRLQADTNGTEDSQYDDMIFMTLFYDDNLISERLENVSWVKGILSPSTAGNLRLAPSQCLKRWEKYIVSSLIFNYKLLKYQSKKFNSNLEVQTTENGLTFEGRDFPIGDDYLFFPEIRSFDLPITFDSLNAIKNNPFGLFKFRYDGLIYLDYLYEVDAERVGSFQCLGSRPMPVKVSPIDYSKLPILKYGDGIEDYLKHSDGDKDYLLYG